MALPARLRRITRVLLPALVLVAIGSIALEVRRIRRPPPPDVTLRNDLLRARAAADSCASALVAEEARFRTHDAQVDSMRSEIRVLESLHSRGVPADTYAYYLEAFDNYNAAVADWGERADSLQANWAACRDLTEQYNALADSVRRMMQ